MSILLLLLLLIIPYNVNAASNYLSNLEVTNGTLLTVFNEKNNIYTIRLDEDAQNVIFTYELKDESARIEVIDNHYDEAKENIMIIKVTNEEGTETQTYTFYLEKEESIATTAIEDATSTLTITKKERSPFLAPSVIIICALCIAILFYLLIIRFFKKKVPNKKSPHNM
ncbi:MAG: cadherin-like beta sandwich domain-containing protein [Bacilli bacterium]|nr:cadherin-like beta sandwich domain-containing protein [Bacilli bacterium]